MAKIGYARVSKNEQSLDQQVLSLTQYGCDIIYKEVNSSVKTRPELEKALKSMNKGDILVVYKLDRLGRSLVDLVYKLDYINKKGAEFVSIVDKFDTTTTNGKMMLGISIVFAEFERNLISDRTKATLKAMKESGVKLGRPGYLDHNKVKQAKKLRKQGYKLSYIQANLGISQATLYRYLNS